MSATRVSQHAELQIASAEGEGGEGGWIDWLLEGGQVGEGGDKKASEQDGGGFKKLLLFSNGAQAVLERY